MSSDGPLKKPPGTSFVCHCLNDQEKRTNLRFVMFYDIRLQIRIDTTATRDEGFLSHYSDPNFYGIQHRNAGVEAEGEEGEETVKWNFIE